MTDHGRLLPRSVAEADSEPAPDFRKLSQQAAKHFRPTAPVNVLDVFSGRERQITRVCDVILQDGQHAVLFGERGVGKTSLANVLSAYLVATDDDATRMTVVSPRVNCDVDDTFDSVWRKVFNAIKLNKAHQPAGFTTRTGELLGNAMHLLPLECSEEPNPRIIDVEAVRLALTRLGQEAISIIIVDEFDRLIPPVRRVFADLIKTLSDHSTPATVVLVGVAESVDGLLEDHQSISRALVQVDMPRMTAPEIKKILVNGARRLQMHFDEHAIKRIVAISQGLPHYAHLLGLNATRVALARSSLHVSAADVRAAIEQAAGDAQHSVKKAYHEAISSAQPGNLFADVLLACALAPCDELGRFKAQDVRGPMSSIGGKLYDIPNFAQHLHEFASAKRGNILKAMGEKRRRVYQFKDPLMQPFVIMQGAIGARLPDAFFGEGD